MLKGVKKCKKKEKSDDQNNESVFFVITNKTPL